MPRQIDPIDDRVQDVSPETTVWRYMRLERFLPMLNNQMYFPRPTQFDDRWEGMFPPSYFRRMRTATASTPDEDYAMEHLRARLTFHRHAHFVSCWHMSDHESNAMWRLYALSPEGLAIKSTVGALLECFRPNGKGAVQYFDPAADQRTINNLFGPDDILWKRQDFEWEREYRIWFDDPEMSEAFSEAGYVNITQPLGGRAFSFHDAQRLIEQIVVAPFATPEYVEILTAVLSQNDRKWMIPLIQRSYSERSWEDIANEVN